MLSQAKIWRYLFWFSSFAIALVSWRFFALGMERAFPAMAHQLDPPRLAFYVHVLAAPIALMIVPIQLSRGFRARRPGAHRILGRICGGAILIGGISGLFSALNTNAGPVAATGFALLSVIWLWTTAQAILHARAGRIADHRAWMIRSAALTFAAVTLRFWLLLMIVAGVPVGIAYPIVAWLSWVLNLLIAELFLRRSAPLVAA